MLSVKIVVVGNLKEEFFRAAEAEYLKRLGGFCKIEVVQLKEERVPDKPSQSEIEAVLTKESKAILAAVPQKAYKIAMCVEGKQLSSEELALQLAANGQIATQYVDLEGNPTMDAAFNPNGSLFAIEGITSPDGRVFGKMGHSERVGKDLYRNVPGNYDIRMFEAAVKYFK